MSGMHDIKSHQNFYSVLKRPYESCMHCSSMSEQVIDALGMACLAFRRSGLGYSFNTSILPKERRGDAKEAEEGQKNEGRDGT